MADKAKLWGRQLAVKKEEGNKCAKPTKKGTMGIDSSTSYKHYDKDQQ